jgi:hypothetical protein
MKKRDVFLFLSFAALFVLFAIFQNFSFPTKQLQQISRKDFFQTQIRKFVPTYSFNDYIGGNIQAPYGYKEEIDRKIASEGQPVIFDQNKFVREGFKTLPVYTEIKSLIDVSNDAEESNPSPDCHVESSAPQNSESVKLRANPLRQTASISVPGEIQSQMMYEGDKKSVNVQFKKDLDKNTGVKLELDSVERSGKVKFDVRW